MEESLWTVEETAAYLGCSPKTVYGWAASGKIPSFKLGGLVRFKREDINAWIEQNRVKNPALEKKLPVRRKAGKVSDGYIDNIVNHAIDSTIGSGYTPN